MAKQYTGIDGSLYLDGNRVAKITNWSLNASADALETTSLGNSARTFVYGVQQASGSCSLLYYENAAGAIEGGSLLTDVVRTGATPTEPTHTMELRLDGGITGRRISFSCLLNQVQIEASIGDVIKADVSFTVSGPFSSVVGIG